MLAAMMPRPIALSLLLLPALACHTTATQSSDSGTVEPEDRAAPKLSTTDPLGSEVIAQLDQSTDPCTDFYQYACGGWFDATPLPADKPRWGRGFGELSQRNNEVLKTILEADTGRAGAYYKGCMDVETVEAAAVEPLAPYLAQIDKLKVGNTKALFKFLGKMDASVGMGAFFGFGLSIDFLEPDLHIADLGQGGTGLPDPSYYLDDAKKAQVLPLYQAHVGRMLTHLGYSEEQASAAAIRVIALETEIAKLQKPPEDMRDPEKIYNRWDRKGVVSRSKLPWTTYFKAIGIPKLEQINVSNPEFIEQLPALIKAADPEAVKDYLRTRLISNTANLLSAEVVDANFQFAGALTGQKQIQPRWERCVAATNGAVGDLVSETFIRETFAGDSKDIAIDMITRVEAAFQTGLTDLEWMDDPTREAAVGKMKKIANKIGYPEKWRTYDGLEFEGSYFADATAANLWANDFALAKIGHAVDKKEWTWPASIVNAGYNPLQNQMLFPAGILQPPFFSSDFPMAMNFGAMGMVMGHELTHGFDDQGRKFDGDGVMREWWADEVSARYDERTACIVETYSSVEVQPETFLNGELTLGENIADFGGIKDSYAAYNTWAAEQDQSSTLIDGLSGQQLFFLSFAQSWCTVASPEFEKLAATVDPHSAPKYRVNIPLAHFPEFWTAYGCEDDTAMHAESVCEVW